MDLNKKNKLKRLASYASVTTAVTLATVKVVASIMSGSLAVLASMVDSLADIIASSITFVSVKYSTKPPSEKYRYGYGRAENLSAIGQAAFIGGSGFFVLYGVVDRFVNPREVENIDIGLYVMLFSYIITLILVLFQRYVYKVTGSKAIKADSVNYTGDLLNMTAIILALFAVKYWGLYWIDNVAALFVAGYLITNAYKLVKDAVRVLMDSELSSEVRDDVLETVLANEFVKGIHDFRTRSLGTGECFEFHLELDKDLSLEKAHHYTHIVEDKIKDKYSESQIIIHQEPAGLDDQRIDDCLC